MDVHHRTMTVGGHTIFYREAGPRDAPAVVLLHGFPTSSYMFRQLIPGLADNYHVLAPDYLGFGDSDAPPADQFDYTFQNLATIVDQFLGRLGVDKYAIYVQDYGAPIGWKLALAHPERITAIISQNGNAYEAGFVEDFWAPVWAYSADPTPETEAALRQALSLEAIRWQYLHGTPDPSLVSPDTWEHDYALIQRAGNDQIQLRLFRDYITNRALYPQVQEFFRASQVPLLAVWGANDGIFAPEGARAFAEDLPNAEIHLLNAGHFALESHLDSITNYVHEFLDRVHARTPVRTL